MLYFFIFLYCGFFLWLLFFWGALGVLFFWGREIFLAARGGQIPDLVFIAISFVPVPHSPSWSNVAHELCSHDHGYITSVPPLPPLPPRARTLPMLVLPARCAMVVANSAWGSVQQRAPCPIAEVSMGHGVLHNGHQRRRREMRRTSIRVEGRKERGEWNCCVLCTVTK